MNNPEVMKFENFQSNLRPDQGTAGTVWIDCIHDKAIVIPKLHTYQQDHKDLLSCHWGPLLIEILRHGIACGHCIPAFDVCLAYKWPLQSHLQTQNSLLARLLCP